MSSYWNWADLGWRERTDGDAERLWRESLRRAVDLRDQLAMAVDANTSRAVFLVDTLNALGERSGFDAADLWTRA